jgi:D-hexose-6-phosphate mutarotase
MSEGEGDEDSTRDVEELLESIQGELEDKIEEFKTEFKTTTPSLEETPSEESDGKDEKNISCQYGTYTSLGTDHKHVEPENQKCGVLWNPWHQESSLRYWC